MRKRHRLGLVGLLTVPVVGACAAVGTAHPGHDEPTSPSAPVAATGPYGNGWRPLPAIASGPRQEHSVARIGRRVFMLGGIVPTAGGVETVARVDALDTRTGTWSTVAPLPVPMNHPNVASVGGRLYVLGGLDGGASWQAIGDSFVYRPKRDRWERLPDAPARFTRGSAAVGVRGHTVYLAGGMRTLTPGPGGLQDTVATASTYDVRTRRWRSLPSLPQARDHVGGAVIRGTFYALGGRDRGQANVRGELFALNLRTRRWTTRAPMPTARGGIAAAAVADRIYTFGGEGNADPASNSVFAQTEAYDTRRDRWTTLPAMPAPRHGTAAVAVRGTIYIPGGGNRGGGAPVDTVDAYRPG